MEKNRMEAYNTLIEENAVFLKCARTVLSLAQLDTAGHSPKIKDLIIEARKLVVDDMRRVGIIKK